MAELSAEELLLLSNLMHMKKEGKFQEIWTKKNEEKEVTIRKMLEYIDEDTLEALRNSDKTYDGEISGAEWADMLEQIQSNKQLCDLKLVDLEVDDKNAISVCLHNEKTGETYVVFRGTGAGEWPDNFAGGYLADTEQQLRALAFVESQPYDNITVVGHSKGGNKAKYVAICSEKVGQCISFDGQGFSPAFFEKYGPLIEQNKDKITCYALDYDFVNILLTDIYGEKFYVNGHGVDSFPQNHSPNSFFNADFEFDKCNQSEAMASLHNFINYIINTGEPEEVAGLMEYLGNVLNFCMGKQPPDYEEKYSSEEIRNYLLDPENAEELGLLLAYIIRYEEGGDNITEVIKDIIEGTDFGFFGEILSHAGADLLEEFDQRFGLELIFGTVEWTGGALSWLLEKFGLLSEEEARAIAQALKVARDKQKEIPKPDKQNCKDVIVSSIKRDFSDEMRTTLLQLVKEVEDEEPWKFWKWDVWYRMEDLFGHLNVENYKNNIEAYHRKVIDINDTTATQMQKIFDAIDELDQKYEQLFQTKVEEFSSITQEIRNIMA